MVLCASNADHTAVQLVDPPVTSMPGDRVTFKGFEGEPATPAQVAKKKIFEKLAPDVSRYFDWSCNLLYLIKHCIRVLVFWFYLM